MWKVVCPHYMTEPVHQSFLMCHLRCLTPVLPLSFVRASHRITHKCQRAESLSTNAFCRGNCYLFSCLKASFNDTHNWVLLLFCGFRIRADSRTNKFSHWISKTKKVYGLQRVREENWASIIIQTELLHKGELGNSTEDENAPTKLTTHSEPKFPYCVQREETTISNES